MRCFRCAYTFTLTKRSVKNIKNNAKTKLTMSSHENGNGTIEAVVKKSVKKSDQNDAVLLKKIQHLERALQQNEMALEQAVDSVVIIDADKNITFFNSAAERTFGYNRNEVLG